MTKTIHVLNKALALHQCGSGFKTSIDAVLLAAACPATAGQSVLDLGCGVGTAGLCAMYRVPGITLTGIDIQKPALDLAVKNADLNGFAPQTHFIEADITRYRAAPVDHIICNPPFLEAGTHTASPDESLAKARGHDKTDVGLQNWIDAAFHNLKPFGALTLIHRADHTDKIIQGLGRRFGATEIIPLWPKSGVPAKRVIIRSIKNRKTPSVLHPGLVLHKGNGDYTDDATIILRDGMALALN